MPGPNDIIRVKWQNGQTTLIRYGDYQAILAMQRAGTDFQKMSASIVAANNAIVKSQQQQAAARLNMAKTLKGW